MPNTSKNCLDEYELLTVFTTEQNLLSAAERELLLECGCLLAVSAYRTSKGFRWFYTIRQYRTVCSSDEVCAMRPFPRDSRAVVGKVKRLLLKDALEQPSRRADREKRIHELCGISDWGPYLELTDD